MPGTMNPPTTSSSSAIEKMDTESVFSATGSDFSESGASSLHSGTTFDPFFLQNHQNHQHGDEEDHQHQQQTVYNSTQRPLFTCIACHVAFQTAEQQRDHYRSDWHRYNLKRKVIDLPPVSATVFRERVLAQQASITQEKAKSELVLECKTCKKSYSSENAYQNHLGSKKHKEMELKQQQKAEKDGQQSKNEEQKEKAVESVSTSANTEEDSEMSTKTQKVNWKVEFAKATTESQMMALLDAKIKSSVRLTPVDCLFCPHASKTFEQNLAHMSRVHSFYIPDPEYLVDLPGLIAFLGEKITVGNVCIYCNGKGRTLHSVEAVRKHMIDKGHCKMIYDDGQEIEYADYYDFSSTWEGVADDDDQFEDIEDDEDFDMESAEHVNADGEDEDDDSDTSTINQQSLRNTELLVMPDTQELILPSGAKLGHRSYAKYYRQSLKPTDANAVVVSGRNKNQAMISRLMKEYKSIGWSGTYSQESRESMMQAKQKRHVEDSMKLSVGIKNNNQKNYRPQVMY